MLRQQPVREPATAAAARELDTRHVDATLQIAPHLQVGPVDRQVVQAQLRKGNRHPGKAGAHQAQFKRHAIRCVVHRDLPQIEVGPDARPTRVDMADGDPGAERSRNPGADFVAIVVHARQYDLARHDDDQRKREP